ncbi:unnamed protein product, partial [Toxocara canis]|uniref:Peptidase A2 domain-containing protein n=1 Tax=Toxocara canis TaxID=6265 RepID=A0A183U217_TOXCA
MCFDDIVKTLKELFGHNTPVFARRYPISELSATWLYGMVSRRHEMAEFDAITLEQMKCLVWICGLHTADDADIRTRALRKMEDKPQATLRELSLETQQFLNIKQDAKLLGSPPSLLQPEVNAVATKKNRTRDPLSPCFPCGGSRWERDCYVVNKTCHNCKFVVHRKGYCKNFANKKRNLKKRRTTNNVVAIASNGTDIAPVNRICRKVQISGSTVQMRLDTGAEVTLLSIKDWIKIIRP